MNIPLCRINPTYNKLNTIVNALLLHSVCPLEANNKLFGCVKMAMDDAPRTYSELGPTGGTAMTDSPRLSCIAMMLIVCMVSLTNGCFSCHGSQHTHSNGNPQHHTRHERSN